MAKIAGTYSIRIADKDASDGGDGETLLTVHVRTKSSDDAATAAEAIGNALDRLGVSIGGAAGNE
jgi:hypothetical protein